MSTEARRKLILDAIANDPEIPDAGRQVVVAVVEEIFEVADAIKEIAHHFIHRS